MYVRIEQIEEGVTDPTKYIYFSIAFSWLTPEQQLIDDKFNMY